MRKAFSIAELMIVVAIIGILAALAVPYLSNHAVEAREAAAKDNLRVLRDAIEFYAIHHGDVVPGYEGNDRRNGPTAECFRRQLVVEASCLRKVPINPFNDLDTILIVKSGESFSEKVSGDYGWLYQPTTATIRLDWPGKDGKDMPYLQY
jgi:prepilin-type N-terminal cleavage/methylation domain-containing protein